MLLQNATACCYCRQYAICYMPPPDGGHQIVNDRVPRTPLRQAVSPVVDDNLSLVFSQRHKQKNAAAMPLVSNDMIGESAMG